LVELHTVLSVVRIRTRRTAACEKDPCDKGSFAIGMMQRRVSFPCVFGSLVYGAFRPRRLVRSLWRRAWVVLGRNEKPYSRSATVSRPETICALVKVSDEFPPDFFIDGYWSNRLQGGVREMSHAAQGRSKMSLSLPIVRLGPAVRWKHCYKIPQAGAKRGWSKSQSYREAAAGNIAGLVRFTDKIMGVRKSVFDADTARVIKEAR
jgi:hypothetical protein